MTDTDDAERTYAFTEHPPLPIETAPRTNITPDALDVPMLGRRVAPGETVDVPLTQGDGSELHWPADIWGEAGRDDGDGQSGGRTVAELQDELRARGLPVSGTKAELADRLAEHDDDSTDGE